MCNRYMIYGFQGWNPTAAELAEIDNAMNQAYDQQVRLLDRVMADESAMDTAALAVRDIKRRARC